MKHIPQLRVPLLVIGIFLTRGITHAGTVTVNSIGNGDSRDTVITLREAIMLSEGSLAFAGLTPSEQAQVADAVGAGLADTIDFGISGTITPTSALPEIFDNGTIIDAASQWIGIWPGGQPGITLEGSSAGKGSGFVINGADNCRIRGLLITGFGGNGVVIAIGARFNTVGGSQAGERNVISGNDGDGIFILSASNVVQGNYIGTDITGRSDLGNTFAGVQIQDAPNNTVGGSQAGESNVISGNGENGIFIWQAGASGNVVQGNTIGTDVTGSFDLGNLFNGVVIQDAPNNTVGGSQSGEGNIISGNDFNGIVVFGFNVPADASGNVLQGNFIGTDVTGSSALGNGGSGVLIQNAHNNTVGGSQAGARNVISGNDGAGILIFGADADGNEVQGNYIGTDVTGSFDLGNVFPGVQIEDSPNNTVGGSQAGEGNVISGNDESGILIRGPNASGNVVQDNFIGTDANGTADLGNAFDGVEILAPNNLIGGSQAGEGNVISGNDFDGIFIVGANASGNVVQGNFIGTDVTGSADLGNARSGVEIKNAPNNTVGGTQAGARNVISGNDDLGIFILGAGASGNVVQGNTIGADLTGSLNLGNGVNGVGISGARGNTIGGIESGEANVIAFNDSNGVAVGRSLGGTDTGSNSIRGNAIFSNASLGIDLGDDGPNANDDFDADAGPNNLQNYPILTSATGGSTRIAGSLNSVPNKEFDLDFYANSKVDESGFGEGERYVGSLTVMTDGSGQISFDVTLENEILFGESITATATDSLGNTSEFSASVAVLEGTKPNDAGALGGIPLGEHFFFSEWYGIYNTTFFPWVFHTDHGWQFVFATDNPEAVFLFDLESQDFWWTTSAFQSLTFYSFNRGTFNFYFQGTTHPRSFVDLETQEFWFIPE